MPQGNSISNITPATMQLQFTIAGSAVAGTSVNAQFVAFSGAQPVSSISVPPDQVWSLTNLYVPSALTINLLVNFTIGQTPQSLNTDTSVIVRVGNSSAINPFDVHIIIDSSQTFYFYGTTDITNSSTSAVTETVYLGMIQYPVAIAQQLNAKGIAL